MRKVSLFLTLLLCSLIKINATVVYVDSANVAGFQDGTSWATAYSSFQAGVNAANAGDSVWVAKATYMPAANSSFTMKEGVKVFGGFLNTYTSFAQRDYGNNVTTLKGNTANYSIISNDTTHLTNASVLDGFTLTGTSYNTTVFTGNYGSALYNNQSSPVIANCIFFNNATQNDGGAMYNYSSSPLIYNCSFTSNVAYQYSGSNGGAIYNVVSSPIINNCTFTGNTSTGSVTYGGAIYNSSSSPIINQCTFIHNGNITNVYGGGAIANSHSNPVISNCSFLNNVAYNGGAIYNGGNPTMPIITADTFTSDTAGYLGGAIYNTYTRANINNCVFNHNVVHYISSSTGGGAICFYSPISINDTSISQVSNCTFTGNIIPGAGTGGAIIVNDGYVNITGCSFSGNKTAGLGGGIYYDNGFTGPPYTGSITNCSFMADTAQYGGGLCVAYNGTAVTVVNNLFNSNYATVYGGAIYDTVASPKIINCTITNNTATTSGGGIYNASNSAPSISNTIVYNNSSGIVNDGTSSPAVFYSLIQGYPAVPANHIIAGTTDPLFVDAANGNYALQATSLCINKGSNDSIPTGITTDLAGNARIYNDTVDIGAYEYVVLPPVVTLGNDTSICSGSTLTLDAGNAGSTYLWSTGATTQTINVTTAGSYSVTVTNAAGTASDTIQVSILSFPVVDLGNDTTFCSGDSLTLDAGNAGATYLWSTGATTQTITANTTGTYSVTVTNANGCSASDSKQITIAALPVVTLGNDTTFCSGNSLTLDAGNAGATYLWNTGVTTQTITANTTGTYSVTVTNANGCSASDSKQITIAALPVVSLGNDTTFCSGNSLTLDAGNAGATYLWNTGATTQTISVNTADDYSVTVTNANGCAATDSKQITVADLPVVNLGSDTTICSGSSLTLDAENAGATYLWSTGATTQTISVNAADDYSVTVTNTNGCSASGAIQVAVVAPPTVDLGDDITVSGDTYTLDAGNPGCTYLWSNGVTTQTITVNATGTYSVVVTNSNGCSDSDTIKVTFNTTGTNDIAKDDGLIISPNPTKGNITLDIKSPGLLKTKAYITDINGKVLQRFMIRQKIQTISLSDFADGIYFFRLENGKTFKIVKE